MHLKLPIYGCDHAYFSQTAPSDLRVVAGMGVVPVHYSPSYPQIFNPSPCYNNILYMGLCTLLHTFSYERTRRSVVFCQGFCQYRSGLCRHDITWRFAIVPLWAQQVSDHLSLYDKVCCSAKWSRFWAVYVVRIEYRDKGHQLSFQAPHL